MTNILGKVVDGELVERGEVLPGYENSPAGWAAEKWGLERWGVSKIPWPWTALFRGQLDVAGEVLFRIFSRGLHEAAGWHVLPDWEDLEHPRKANDCFSVTPWVITRTVRSFGMSRLPAILDGMKEVWQGPLPMHLDYERGYHYGDLFVFLLPVKRLGKKRLREYIRVSRDVEDYSRVFISDIPLGDIKRLARLSRESRRFVLSFATYSSGVDWDVASALLRCVDINELEEKLGSDIEDILSCYRGGVAKEYAWKMIFKRLPKSRAVFSLDVGLIKMLKPVFKHFNWLLGQLEKVDGEYLQHDVIAAANLAITFGGQVKQLQPQKARGSQWIHDWGIDLKPPYSKEEVKFLWKYREKLQDFRASISVLNRISDIQKFGGHLGMPLRELRNILLSLDYEGIKSIPLATECSKWGVDPEEFEEIQDEWISGLEKLKHEAVPRVDITSGDYRFYRLEKEDPRGVFLGHYTNCCQHPLGAGKSCARHGHESPYGAFFVVEHRGQIIAQSWCWRRNNTLVFDSIEEVGGSDDSRSEKVAEMYSKGAQALIGRLCVEEVLVGKNELGRLLKCTPAAKQEPAPSGCYTDALTQKLLAGGEESA